MRLLILLVWVSIVVAVLAGSNVAKVKEVRTRSQLKDHLSSSSAFKVVVFHSPHCSACQKFLTILHKAHSQLREGSKPIEYYTVDVLAIPSMIPTYHITRLPAVWMFEGQTRKSQLDQSSVTQEFLVLNWVKKETGIPGANPFFAKTSAQQLSESFGEGTSAAEAGTDADSEVGLTQNLVQAVYGDGIHSHQSTGQDQPVSLHV